MKHHRELLATELGLYGHQTTHVILAKEQEDLKKEFRGLRGVSKKQHDRCEEIRCRLGEIAAQMPNTTRNLNDMKDRLSKIDTNISAQIEKWAKEIDSKLRSQLRGAYH
jgi:chromosome segregation ATPase